MVCKKRSLVCPVALDELGAIHETNELIEKLKNAGMSISTADRFVVLASQILIQLSTQELDFDAVCEILQNAQRAIQPTALIDIQEPKPLEVALAV